MRILSLYGVLSVQVDQPLRFHQKRLCLLLQSLKISSCHKSGTILGSCASPAKRWGSWLSHINPSSSHMPLVFATANPENSPPAVKFVSMFLLSPFLGPFICFIGSTERRQMSGRLLVWSHAPWRKYRLAEVIVQVCGSGEHAELPLR